MCSTLPIKSFFSSCKPLQALGQFIIFQPYAQQLGQDIANFGRQLVVRPHNFSEGNSGISYLGVLLSPNCVSNSSPLGDLYL